VSGALRVLVVDDEPPARAMLADMLRQAGGVEVVGECANGFEAVQAAEAEKPDAVFLDIQMPRLTGLEVAELLDPAIAVVFVTAYDEHAVRAFEANAADYVLKPFRQERLLQSVEKARRRRAGRATPSAAALSEAVRPAGEFASRIVVRDGPRVHVIPAADLDWARAEDDYVRLAAGGREFLKAQTLSGLAGSLDPARFLRVHRSYLVNVDRLRRIEITARDSHVAVLSSGVKIPISRDGYARLKALLGEG
jgi:two-component system LytT family response regulator